MLRLLAFGLILPLGCSSVTGETRGPYASEADYLAQRTAAVAELSQSIGTPEASDVRMCRAIGFGEQACGGPTSFAVYSVATADTVRVEAAAERVTRLDVDANEQFGYVSTCMLHLPPPLKVEAGVCASGLAP